MAKIEYEPQGICPRLLRFEVEDNKLKGFQALGGCNGNLQGLGRLTEGMDIDEVISVKEIQYVGIEARVFLCRATVGERQWLFELKYTIRTHCWCLMRKVY